MTWFPTIIVQTQRRQYYLLTARSRLQLLLRQERSPHQRHLAGRPKNARPPDLPFSQLSPIQPNLAIYELSEKCLAPRNRALSRPSGQAARPFLVGGMRDTLTYLAVVPKGGAGPWKWLKSAFFGSIWGTYSYLIKAVVSWIRSSSGADSRLHRGVIRCVFTVHTRVCVTFLHQYIDDEHDHGQKVLLRLVVLHTFFICMCE